MSKPLQQISRTQQLSMTMLLLRRQGGNCAVCGIPIDTKTKGRGSDYALDHNHETGEVRGVLHRSCNSALGKLDHAVGRWGAKSMQYSAILPYLKAVVAYYEACDEKGTGLLYPNHKTPEQANEAARVKRNKQAAARRAKERAIKLKTR